MGFRLPKALADMRRRRALRAQNKALRKVLKEEK